MPMTKTFKILLKDDTNEYISGRIAGFIRALSDDENMPSYAHIKIRNTNQRMFRVNTTINKYRKIRKMIEMYYPDYCVFYN